MSFPEFPYHPDPRATGFVRESDRVCRACGDARGYVYTGPVFAVEELRDELCPWCIADGTAAAAFDAQFTDVDDDVPGDVPPEAVDRIARRTPGFSGWQQEHWLYHCGDGAAFLGLAGAKELEPHPDAIDALRRELDDYGWSQQQVEEYLASLDRDGQPTAYLFRCRRCRRHLAYSDFT
ncbi:MAG TPA: CbrC family protein [Gaiellaceae bacterium]|jgi:hypothetical protein